MRFEVVEGAGAPAARAAELRALVPGGDSVSAAVTEIIRAVREGGDGTLRELTERFDTQGGPLRGLEVEPEILARARDHLPADVRAGLEAAIENVGRVAAAGLAEDRTVDFATHSVTLRTAPVARAAVYVPGGRAAYPSTVVMGVITARTAGVEEVAVVSPPGRDGELPASVLAACALAGASRVHRAGGAQAIAALAYGTETIAPVDVIVGPGNLYVQEAKRQVADRVGIDGFAGPSDLVALMGEGAPAEQIGLDLAAQAEHGPGTLVVAIAASREIIDALGAALEVAPESGAVARLVHVPTLEAGFALAEALAPEHLQLAGAGAEALAPRVRRAGSVFVGAASGAAFGDYIAGSNHVLPTDGAARFASALSVRHFRRGFTETRITDAGPLALLAGPVARAEGFEAHARSMEARAGRQ